MKSLLRLRNLSLLEGAENLSVSLTWEWSSFCHCFPSFLFHVLAWFPVIVDSLLFFFHAFAWSVLHGTESIKLSYRESSPLG